MNFVDTHMHVNKKEEPDYNKIITNAIKNNVEIMLNVGCERNTIEDTILTSKKFKNVYPVIGIHPIEATGKSDIQFIKKHFNSDIVAIGEIGLDLHYHNNPPLKIQIKTFEDHLDFALEKKIPVVIHSRDADQETYQILSKPNYKELTGLLHSYPYGAKSLQKYLDLGFYISFSGIVTFKKAHDMQLAATKTPQNRIFTETDTPYLTPVPYRGQKNQPMFVKYIVQHLANLRQEKLLDLTRAIRNNVKELFKI